jgi:hypothetical protein
MARTITISDLLGLNNVLPPEQFLIKENFKTVGYYLSKAKNIDIDNGRKPRRRLGQQVSLSGSNCHSLWSDGKICLFREGSDLKRLSDSLLSSTTLRTGITGSLSMAYLPLDGKVYYSDGNISGVIENGVSRSWGLSVPPSPVLSLIPGNLPSGLYQVCVTYVRNDGQESGASESSILELTNSTSGIRISGIISSSDPSVLKINVYVTRRDSEIFYRAYTLVNGTQSVDYITEGGLSAIKLKSQFLSPPPAGQILEYYKGRIYIGSFDALWYTEPFRYELCDMSTNFIQFESDMSLVGAVEDGMYFGTDNEIIFAGGDQPKSFKLEQKADYGAIFGTMQKIQRPDVGRNEVMSTLLMFASTKGICIASKGGDLQNQSRDTFLYEPAYSGASLVRRTRGIDQYLFTLNGEDRDRQEMNIGYGDLRTTEPVLTITGAATTN